MGESENHMKQENEVSYTINNLSLNVTMNLLAFFGFGFVSYSSHWLSYCDIVSLLLLISFRQIKVKMALVLASSMQLSIKQQIHKI